MNYRKSLGALALIVALGATALPAVAKDDPVDAYMEEARKGIERERKRRERERNRAAQEKKKEKK